ncbi:hypothetical protein ACWNYH_00300 [Candidatus Vidania fulgoroideorum]
MQRLKLIRYGRKKSSIYRIVSIDCKRKGSINCTYIGRIDRKEKKIQINIKKMILCLKNGVGISFGIRKLIPLLCFNYSKKNYEITPI